VPLLTYSLLRLVLFVAAVGVLWLAGLRHWALLTGFGVVIAAALSYLFLAKQRDATTAWLAGRARARAAERGVAGEDEAVEDAAVDGMSDS